MRRGVFDGRAIPPGTSPETCVSLISTQRSVNLEFPDEEVRELCADGFTLLMNRTHDPRVIRSMRGRACSLGRRFFANLCVFFSLFAAHVYRDDDDPQVRNKNASGPGPSLPLKGRKRTTSSRSHFLTEAAP